jgi:hypothetical protein
MIQAAMPSIFSVVFFLAWLDVLRRIDLHCHISAIHRRTGLPPWMIWRARPSKTSKRVHHLIPAF